MGNQKAEERKSARRVIPVPALLHKLDQLKSISNFPGVFLKRGFMTFNGKAAFQMLGFLF